MLMDVKAGVPPLTRERADYRLCERAQQRRREFIAWSALGMGHVRSIQVTGSSLCRGDNNVMLVSSTHLTPRGKTGSWARQR